MPVHDIGLEHVSLDFATKTIFRDVTLGVVEGDRIGIVGKNGDGKSTLLHILTGAQSIDDGRVTRRGGLTLGMLDQWDSLDDAATVREAALEGREEYEWAADATSRGIVETLLLDIPLDATVGQLSGGQRRRVDLARLLLKDWDILVLDEPTNHLDMPTIHWLAAHLKSRWSANSGALLVVTHDRWFLDEVCTRMWEVHDGTIDPFEGGYSAYMMQRVERERQADVAETKRRNLARKELAWLTRGARARSTKQKFHVKAARELIADVPEPRNTVELKAMATSRLGKQVVDLIDVTQVYEQNADELTPGSVSVQITEDDEQGVPQQRTVTGKRILDNVTWLIGPGDRFGIVGANGVGKSTLLKILDGTLTPTAGHVNIGKTVKFAVLSQRLDELEALGKYRVKEVLSRYKPTYIVDGKETTPGQLMERLGFEAAQLMTPVADLSGGQKRRMQLLLILLDEPNVLIMDEPGNDLDTDMLAVMEDLLDTWPGTLIVVSHDAYLLERVTDHQFAIFDGKIRHLPGGVDDYFRLLEGQDVPDNPISGGLVSTGSESVLCDAGVEEDDAPQLSAAEEKAKRIAKHEASKRMSAIERKMDKLADEIKKIDEQMAAADPSDFVGLGKLNEQRDAVQAEISALEAEWLEKSEIVEG
ncbi:ABC transporter ATP-binding protein [Alloscardovia macacae]|uniref:ABC transporter ATP-binding protein n=1 Tax=Alloscardovia macacae TaxID=1160091 RepID=A0A1Y2SWS2_9BIFI|nr:ABC-F family ATP-binding cassette domain-containing protein [Alloscardovia macacae]OTA26606.1 ABC transporter ATP-binding protein [Alloscardovia macacae]OTA29008.1 ABC transporter ATP-binding protein [Alloscardovia macacae]